MADYEWIVLRLNPQPWAIGPLSLGRKPGGFYPKIGPNAQLVAYQNAVREGLQAQGVKMLIGEVELRFYFSRTIESYKRRTGRNVSAHASDITNLQKATEDALQGVLIANDRDVVACSSVLLDQGVEARSFIIIRISRPHDHQSEIPKSVLHEALAEPEVAIANANWLPPAEDDF
jgi:Holliday junction resolvase RusA-like endonuclease